MTNQIETLKTIDTSWACYTAAGNRRITEIVAEMVSKVESGVDPSEACEAMWKKYEAAAWGTKMGRDAGMSDTEVRMVLRDWTRKFIAETLDIHYYDAADIVEW